ncbi:50S ribosomal protein L17 [bacterium]|nr:50S ribosomal protein L17 [bacterium]
MRHNVDGRKFGRNTSHRVAMLKNVANAVIEREQIVTTIQKAKEARRVVDRLITLAKDGTLHSRRVAFSRSRNKEVVKKLFSTLADRYKTRAGGYTRILKLSERRWGDAAEMAILELVDRPELDRKRKPKAVDAKQAEGADDAKAVATDPFKKFRKMLGGGKSKVGEMGGKAGRAPKGGAGRKTPAGGGSSKTGGSS